VAFADQDDIWDRRKLIRASRMLLQCKAAGYSSATTAAWPDGRTSVLTQTGIPGRADFLFEGAGQGCTFVLSADLYRRVRDFITRRPELTRKLHYHDWAVYALARTWNLRWSFDPRPSMMYLQHGSNDTGARITAAGIGKRLHLIRAGWYRAQLHAVAELCSAAEPANPTVRAWRDAFLRPDGWNRRLAIARFCSQGGRRRMVDNTILLFGALAGWI
jgi:rhamnosyltransferase